MNYLKRTKPFQLKDLTEKDTILVVKDDDTTSKTVGDLFNSKDFNYFVAIVDVGGESIQPIYSNFKLKKTGSIANFPTELEVDEFNKSLGEDVGILDISQTLASNGRFLVQYKLPDDSDEKEFNIGTHYTAIPRVDIVSTGANRIITSQFGVCGGEPGFVFQAKGLTIDFAASAVTYTNLTSDPIYIFTLKEPKLTKLNGL